jgi:hypothetical protein
MSKYSVYRKKSFFQEHQNLPETATEPRLAILTGYTQVDPMERAAFTIFFIDILPQHQFLTSPDSNPFKLFFYLLLLTFK